MLNLEYTESGWEDAIGWSDEEWDIIDWADIDWDNEARDIANWTDSDWGDKVHGDSIWGELWNDTGDNTDEDGAGEVGACV